MAGQRPAGHLAPGRTRSPPPAPVRPRWSARRGRRPRRNGRAPAARSGCPGGVSASARSKLASAAACPGRAPLPGEGEEPQRRRFQLRRLLGLPGGAGELERGRVVVGEHVGEVLDPVGRLRLDPGRRGDVAGGARGARELGVGDVAGQDVPEGVLGLARHRRVPRRAARAPCARARAACRTTALAVALAHLRRPPRPRRPCRSTAASASSDFASGVEGVEAGGDQRLHRGRERHLGALPELPARAVPHEQVAVLAAAGRTPRRRAGCPPARSRIGCCSSAGMHGASRAAPRRDGRSPRGERREVDRCRRCAAPPRSRGGARRARAGRCRRRAAAHLPRGRRGARGRRASRRRPSGGPRTRARSGAPRRPSPGTCATR